MQMQAHHLSFANLVILTGWDSFRWLNLIQDSVECFHLTSRFHPTNRSLAYSTLLGVLWLIGNVRITYGTVRRTVLEISRYMGLETNARNTRHCMLLEALWQSCHAWMTCRSICRVFLAMTDHITCGSIVRSTQIHFLMCTLEIPQKLQYKFLLLTFCLLALHLSFSFNYELIIHFLFCSFFQSYEINILELL